MKAVFFSTAIILLLSFHGLSEDVEVKLIVVNQDQKYSDAGKPTDVLIEYLAKPGDVIESKKWHPSSDSLLAPMKKIIEIAYENMIILEGKLVYVKPLKYVEEPEVVDFFSALSPPPDFRGADLREMNDDLWFWDVYFGLHLDRSIESQASIRGGDLILSSKVLPNGGSIEVKERKMTSQERISYGLDPDPKSKGPFAP